ncbi:MAG: branched-chain amino acid ABC transporter permease [Anaerolineaceae bacterium]
MDALSTILQQVINAIQLSSAYALIAVGYTMVYGVLKLINFAHADIFMVGAYVSYFVYQWIQAPFLVCLGASMIFCALLAVLIERIAYKPLRTAPRLSVLITAIGVSLTLEHGTRATIGPEYRPFPAILPKITHQIGGVFITEAMFWALLTSVVLMGILTYIVRYTYLGKAMRAVSFDKEAAMLMGINIDRVITYTFALGAAEAGAAGVVWGLAYPMIDPYMGMIPGIKGFVAAVVGGIGSVPGALAGSFIIGTVETATAALLPSMYRDAISFAILALVLIVRPTGIFGIGSVEKV